MIHKEKLPSLLALTLPAPPANNGALPDTSGKVAQTGTAVPQRALTARYREVLGKLWLLNAGEAPLSARHHRADLEAARELLAEQARLCDELGATLASAIGQQPLDRGFRAWAAAPGAGCPACFTTLRPGAEIPLAATHHDDC